MFVVAGCGGSDDPAFSSGSGGAGGGGGGGQDTPPAGQCRTSKSVECPGTCVSPEDIACYAPVEPITACVNDPDCGGTPADPHICTYLDVSCAGGPGFACAKGCDASTVCPEGQKCGPDHHCQKVPCGGGGNGCDVDFLCSGEGHCVRSACKLDADCAEGRCVLGLCHDDFGVCLD